MREKTNFLKKAMTSIYDMQAFAKYSKEGIFRATSYAMMLTLILVIIKVIITIHEVNAFEWNFVVHLIIINFSISFFDLMINCLIVVIIASIFIVFMKMMVKYIALYSLTLYAATLPLLIKTVLEVLNPDIDFSIVFIIGTLTYVLLILKYIKEQIIRNARR